MDADLDTAAKKVRKTINVGVSVFDHESREICGEKLEFRSIEPNNLVFLNS
jgi:hypothetical protein